MGSPEDESGRFDEETLHEVELTRGFWMGETPVTQGQWRQVMENNPSHFSKGGDDCPVEKVSWYDAVTFANRLSEMAGGFDGRLESFHSGHLRSPKGTSRLAVTILPRDGRPLA